MTEHLWVPSTGTYATGAIAADRFGRRPGRVARIRGERGDGVRGGGRYRCWLRVHPCDQPLRDCDGREVSVRLWQVRNDRRIADP